MARAIALAVALALTVAPAWAAIFHGAGPEDPEMTVTLRASKAGVVRFDYVDVMVQCSSGDQIREPGGEHSTMLGEKAKFSDTIEQDLDSGATATSYVRGRIRGRRARGIVVYDLLYEGGECHSGKVRWKARHKKFSRRG